MKISLTPFKFLVILDSYYPSFVFNLIPLLLEELVCAVILIKTKIIIVKPKNFKTLKEKKKRWNDLPRMMVISFPQIGVKQKPLWVRGKESWVWYKWPDLVLFMSSPMIRICSSGSN